MYEIRPFQDADWDALWQILEPVFRAGTTYPVPMDISEREARRLWVGLPDAAYVASDASGDLLGSYYLKPIQPAGGRHVCNCGYVVEAQARGRGIASRLCEHSMETARAAGFRAMQFNFVVSTNDGAVRLWQRHGFETVGTLPGAFQHPQHGEVDVFVMYQRLVS